MDARKPDEDGLQVQGSWIPTTPVKPHLPRPTPIYTDGQGNQIERATWLGSETFSSFTEGSQTGRLVACCNSPNCSEFNRTSINNWNEETCEEESHMDRWNYIPFGHLLALADAASAASGTVAHLQNDDVATSSLMRATSCQNECNGEAYLWSNVNCMPKEPHYEVHTHRQYYDLNLPPETMSNANSCNKISKFAPITPEKDMRVQNKLISEEQNLCADGTKVEEREKLKNDIVTARVGTNEFQHNKELLKPVTDSSVAAISTPFKEDHNPDKGGSHGIDPSKTPQEKPRRKKHRPKVITEGKPKRTPKPVTPKATTGKRKYVRRKGLSEHSTTPAELTGESTDLKTLEPARKSCRRALKFDIEQSRDESSTFKCSINLDSELQAKGYCNEGVQLRSPVQISEGIEVMVERTEAGIAYDLTCSMDQMLKEYISLPERQAPSTSLPTQTSPPQAELNANSQKDSYKERECQPLAHDGQEHIVILSKEEQARQSKRSYSHAAKFDDASVPNLVEAHFNTLDAYQIMNWMHFPNIYKKKRTEKGQNSATSCSSSCVTATKDVRPATCLHREAEVYHCSTKGNTWASCPQFEVGTVSPSVEEGIGNQQSFQHFLAFIQTERSTRKRSRGRPTRVRNLTALTKVSECITHLTKQPLGDGDGKTVENPHKPHTSIDNLVEKMSATPARRKRSKKRNSLVISATSSMNEMQLDNKLVLYNCHPSSSDPLGASHEVTWKQNISIDARVEQFKNLSIDRESRKLVQQHNAVNMQYQDHSALVLYKRDGTVVPYEGWFAPIKKRRPRPKVDLDEETNRVWTLLMGNINSEGIDGTDEGKAKWWEEERRVFRGRADSFIARMHLVQGDRRFSQWKGSVVDSVIGVFLTQNVSDHLSSSAFMSLAARFPLNSKSNHEACYEEGVSFIVSEPEVCLLDTEDSIQWKTACDQSSMTLYDPESSEEKEVVNSNDSPGGSIGDPVSSQNSVFSSQNSSDVQTAEKIGSCLESNSEADHMLNSSEPNGSDGSATIADLGQMAGSTMLNEINGSRNASSIENSKDECYQFKGMNHENHRQNAVKLNDPQSFLGASMDPSSSYHLHPTPTSRILEVQYSEIFREETQFSGVSNNKDENSIKEKSAQTIESSTQAAFQTELVVNVEKAPRSPSESCNNVEGDENVIISSQSPALGDPKIVGPLAQGQNTEIQQDLPNLSEEILDGTQKTSVSDLNACGNLFSNEMSEMKTATVKAKSKKAQKEKKDEFNWDSLRKQVEADGKKRERTANTMDSLDWEAVRSAGVHEIADAIKERGMNNVLAGRIQDFLNRLVREHGSIDLEWLRDVPPDQVKEYLLSIRGLGLKSVECVRLLTLHHLAFPVDTNVGRIAVRLGWVPLQPLPESLQLHLLELYPVLESIQKYLWPRLCKLDQRTLYELHYQMITFGKVFCTKSKPNCNSCPMRGECRHFASAFASARLALPGPEEKSIVTAAVYRPAENPDVIIDQLALPFPQAANQSEGKSGVTNCEPIIEEPATPEPECTQAENDIEDTFYEDPNGIPIIKLNIEEFTQNLQNYMQNSMELQEVEMSNALVALTPEAASIPMPKLKNVSRLRTEHQVYELPDSHPLLEGLDKREPDDPCSYLLAIWTPGETANSIQAPEKRCSSQEYGRLCDDTECFSCNSIREANSQTVRGTLLVFADHNSSLNPIDVPRDWIWNLRRRTVYFGTSIPTIFKGLSTEGIQHCFWRGYVCVRGFDQKTRAPRPLMARLHLPASRLTTTKGKTDGK
ncbi:hypothetical protein F2P56_005745 [Juglans regia]|uniref:Transcriptional activator DEMETER-like isoform X2 n=2 Tax=Juglans regia TaxID=51240 RepID=A0A2I4DYZ9_JUGRE|nr:transcriptional activator DEMETER-like isoform X2 [Juglans regia]KAF5473785.1 hypothetical protein F2P56_005745 [Juglans regia]